MTGQGISGRATILSDIPVSVLNPKNRPGVEVPNLWVATETSTILTDATGCTQGPVTLIPLANGPAFRIGEFSPEKDWINQRDWERLSGESFASFGAEQALDDSERSRRPPPHKTETVDHARVPSGECPMALEDPEMLVTANDVIIQRGINRAWSNRLDRPCRSALVLIDGTGGQLEPL